MTDRTPQFVVTTPHLNQVVVWKDTWDNHILPQQRTGSPEAHTIATLTNPTAVVIGTSNPSYLCYVNHDLLSPGSGNPFVAIVDPNATPLPALASIGYRREFKELTHHTSVWVPNDG